MDDKYNKTLAHLLNDLPDPTRLKPKRVVQPDVKLVDQNNQQEKQADDGMLTEGQIKKLEVIAKKFSLTGWAQYELITIVTYQAAMNKAGMQLTNKTWNELEQLQMDILRILPKIAAFGCRDDVKHFLQCYEMQKQLKAMPAYPEMQGFAHLANNTLLPAHRALSNLSKAINETLNETETISRKPSWKADKPAGVRGGRHKATRYEGMAIRLGILWQDNSKTVSDENNSLFFQFIDAILKRVLKDNTTGAERLTQKVVAFLAKHRRS